MCRIGPTTASPSLRPHLDALSVPDHETIYSMGNDLLISPAYTRESWKRLLLLVASAVWRSW